MTDQVCRTLFEEFGEHRRSQRGEEEIGWVLLGVREEADALVMATLPAGAHRSAGVAHVRFNSDGQALASRIVRQWDRRLSMVGVVHTHPGSLRHPSEGDYQGAREWLETPIPALANQRPLDLARTEPGAREVEDLIGRIEHGVVS